MKTIYKTTGNIGWDFLPVEIMPFYKETENHYFPFTLFRACICDGKLSVRCWTFQHKCIFNDKDILNGDALTLQIGCTDGIFSFSSNGNSKFISNKLLTVERYDALSGEDHQGLFWGYELTFSASSTKKLLGRDVSVQDVLKFNVIKSNLGEQNNHFGSLIPIKDSSLENPYILCEFEVFDL